MLEDLCSSMLGILVGLLFLWCIFYWSVQSQRQKTLCKMCGGKLEFLDYCHPSGMMWYKCTSCGVEEYRNR